VYDYCRSALPEQSVPEAAYLIKSIPKNAVGKPDYQKLEKDAGERKACAI
jgi:acyl-CoA synthetase (AMP-forming)/AMP-acid ligase II